MDLTLIITILIIRIKQNTTLDSQNILPYLNKIVLASSQKGKSNSYFEVSCFYFKS